MVKRYDAGLLSDYGGGNVEWWQDYLRAEIERCNDHYEAEIAALEKKVRRLEGAAHDLAMLVLQSDMYEKPDFRDAVDNVLSYTARKAPGEE